MSDFFPTPFPRGPRSTFAQRLEWLLDGRSIGGWAKGIGMVGASIDALRGDEARPPSHEYLTRIMRTENASLSWLLGADVPPFLVNIAPTATEAADALRMHLQEEDWKSVALFGSGHTAWVLTQPASIAANRGDIEYTAIQIIAGPSLTSSMLLDVFPAGGRAADKFSTIPITQSLYREVATGHVGTWRLFHAPTPIIGHQFRAGMADYLGTILSPARNRVAEPTPDAPPHPAQSLADAWPTLPPDRRSAVALLIEGILNLPPAAED